jgi:hypothetical protein
MPGASTVEHGEAVDMTGRRDVRRSTHAVASGCLSTPLAASPYLHGTRSEIGRQCPDSRMCGPESTSCGLSPAAPGHLLRNEGADGSDPFISTTETPRSPRYEAFLVEHLSLVAFREYAEVRELECGPNFLSVPEGLPGVVQMQVTQPPEGGRGVRWRPGGSVPGTLDGLSGRSRVAPRREADWLRADVRHAITCCDHPRDRAPSSAADASQAASR